MRSRPKIQPERSHPSGRPTHAASCPKSGTACDRAFLTCPNRRSDCRSVCRFSRTGESVRGHLASGTELDIGVYVERVMADNRLTRSPYICSRDRHPRRTASTEAGRRTANRAIALLPGMARCGPPYLISREMPRERSRTLSRNPNLLSIWVGSRGCPTFSLSPDLPAGRGLGRSRSGLKKKFWGGVI